MDDSTNDHGVGSDERTGKPVADGGDRDRKAGPSGSEPRFATTIHEGVLRVRRPGTRWLSSGWGGGFRVAPAAYNVSVPTGFSRTDLDTYVRERRRAAGFAEPGPALLTGLSLRHARGARSDPVSVIATVGLSNPAALPVCSGTDDDTDIHADDHQNADTDVRHDTDHRRVLDRDDSGTEPSGTVETTETGDRRPTGTVNLLVVTDRALDDAGLTTLLATAVEAKTATLAAETGFPGTTSDAVVVGCDPEGERATFAGSATPVGAAARACVRDAVFASLGSRYPEGEFPHTVAEAKYGVTTTRSTEPFRPSEP